LVRRLIRAPTLERSPKLSLLAIREEEAGAATLRPLPHSVQASSVASVLSIEVLPQKLFNDFANVPALKHGFGRGLPFQDGWDANV
jgi:hypothetical protein